MSEIAIAAAMLSVVAWLYLLWFHGGFWRADQRLPEATSAVPRQWPEVAAIVPARNEARCIERAITSLLAQSYAGRLTVVVVDDQSTDDTPALARRAATRAGAAERLVVVEGVPVPPGWSGKVWALSRGADAAVRVAPEAEFLLITDADILHERDNLHRLADKAMSDRLDLVSLMVRLHCESRWEQLLIPAFVFFFQKLYPFRRVNDRSKRTVAAAGGCMLVRRTALTAAGGFEAIRGELIDDCALARSLKVHGPVWLGLAERTRSLRSYDGLEGIWRMVARTAYNQLKHSPLLLMSTVLGNILLYLVPPLAALVGAMSGQATLALYGSLGWLLMMRCYGPTLKLYGRPWFAGLDLPLAGLLYTLMTIDSARRHWRGHGGARKGRTYNGVGA
jgi:hopene-associated glycosyltransferase HpnB